MDAGALLVQEVHDNTQHFNKNVATLERRMMLLNTGQDTKRLRDEIIRLAKDTVQLARITDSSLKKLNQQSRGMEQAAHNELSKVFEASLQKLQSLQQDVATLEHDMLTGAHSASSSRPPDFTYQPGNEEHDVHHDSMARQQQVVYDENEAALVEHREHEMRELEADLQDMNEILRDLADIMYEQEEIVDNVETNGVTTVVKAESGKKQLEKVVRHKKCCTS